MDDPDETVPEKLRLVSDRERDYGLSNHQEGGHQPELNSAERVDERTARHDPGRNSRDSLQAIVDNFQLFHTKDDEGFADIWINGHRETWPINHSQFRTYLMHTYYTSTGTHAPEKSLSDIIAGCNARAIFGCPEREIFTRVGYKAGRIYIDLCDNQWRAVEIDAKAWRVVDNPPVRFRRHKGMQPLVEPQSGGNIHDLRKYLNVGAHHDLVMVTSWILAALRNHGPYPILVITGEQGSAKSTFVEFLRDLVDPNLSAIRSMPSNDRDLFIAASNAHVLAFDNISRISDNTSDTLCRLATGAGFATRKLHSDGEEILFHAARPIILNGITDFVTRPDLAERAIFIRLPRIGAASRKPLQELKWEFDSDKAAFFATILDAMSVGLRRLPQISLTEMPRMADFSKWATACETAFWEEGAFELAYAKNRMERTEDMLDGNPIACLVLEFMHNHEVWSGTATELLKELYEDPSIKSYGKHSFPRDARGLSSQLNRFAPLLRESGLQLTRSRSSTINRTRVLKLSWVENT